MRVEGDFFMPSPRYNIARVSSSSSRDLGTLARDLSPDAWAIISRAVFCCVCHSVALRLALTRPWIFLLANDSFWLFVSCIFLHHPLRVDLGILSLCSISLKDIPLFLRTCACSLSDAYFDLMDTIISPVVRVFINSIKEAIAKKKINGIMCIIKFTTKSFSYEHYSST